MTLLKCFRQRLLGRTFLKRGRVRKYVYILTERGRKRLACYTRREGGVNVGVVDIDKLVADARSHVTPFEISVHGILNCAESICINTRQENVFSLGKQCASLSVYLMMNRDELTLAFAAKRLLSLITPETLAEIEDALNKPSIKNFVDTPITSFTISRFKSLSKPFLLPGQGVPWIELMMMRIEELHMGQWFLYCMLKEEEKREENVQKPL